MPDEQQYGYDQGQYDQGQYQQDQGHANQNQSHAAGGGQEDEDVEIDWEYTAEEGLHCSMDDLTAIGYEPPVDDDSSHNLA